MAQGFTRYDSGESMSPLDSEKDIFTQIAAAVNRLAGIPGQPPVPGAGGAVQSITQHPSIIVPQGTSQVIPKGAKEWTVTVLTGTATINGAAGCPVGFSDGSDKTLLNDVTITTASTSTAYVRWAT